MAYPTRYYRIYNFLLDQLRGLDLNNGKLDAEFNALQVTVEQLNTRLRGITTADGRLTNVAAATALALSGSERFIATASQTVFTTAIDWDSNFSADSVVCFTSGSRIDSNSVAVANSGGFLAVTLPAQTLSAVVIVDAFAPGTVAAAASTVTVADAAGYYAGSTVETILAEIQDGATYGIRTLIAALPGGTIAGLASYLRKDGSVTMTGSLNMGGGSAGSYVSANGQKIIGLKGGSQNGDAVEWSQFTAFTTVWNSLASYFLKLDGSSVMAGSLNMGSQYITNVKNADLSDTTQAANVATVQAMISASGGLPVGVMCDYDGGTAPTGWLICDGSSVSQTTYAALFAVVGSQHGATSAGNFLLPDCRGRVGVGSGTGTYPGVVTARVLAAAGGTQEEILGLTQIPSHSHTIAKGNVATTGANGLLQINDGSTTTSTNSSGGGLAHNNMPPFLVTTKIIKY